MRLGIRTQACQLLYQSKYLDVDLATQRCRLDGRGGGETPQGQAGARLVLPGAGVQSLCEAMLLSGDRTLLRRDTNLKYTGVQDDHDQAGDVEGSKG